MSCIIDCFRCLCCIDDDTHINHGVDISGINDNKHTNTPVSGPAASTQMVHISTHVDNAAKRAKRHTKLNSLDMDAVRQVLDSDPNQPLSTPRKDTPRTHDLTLPAAAKSAPPMTSRNIVHISPKTIPVA